MKTYEIHEELKTVEVKKEIGVVCDECGKEISETYYEVVTGHYDWGNDSVDSVDSEDICCLECLEKNQKKYFEIANGSEYYNISREYRWSKNK